MRITTELPAGFIILCLLLGAGFAVALYFKQLRKGGDKRAVWSIRTLAILRFISASLLAILLLNPLMRYMQRQVEKPVVILAIDNSASMLMTGDSATTRTQISALVDQVESELSDKYDIYTVLAGDGVKAIKSASYKDQTTDLSSIFKERDLLYGGDNLVAQILISDGIVNQGMNPGFIVEAKTTPFYAVGVGDTSIRKDVRIYEAKANEITFLGNTFPIEVVVNADKCNGQNLVVDLYHNGSKNASANLFSNSDRFSAKHTFLVRADAVGTQQYQIRVSSVGGEVNLQNNSKSVYTEVMDGRQKLALVARGPHPDIAAVKAMVESNDQYELTVFLNDLPSVKKGDYDLIITHQLPLNRSDFNWMKLLKDGGIPMLNILGTQTEIGLFNSLDMGLTINGHRKNYNQTTPKRNTTFSYFDLSESFDNFLQGLPPLITPFGEYTSAAKQGTLFTQRIGQVNTEIPLWMFNDQNGLRNGILTGEGIWRWRMNDFELHDHFDHVNEMMSRAVQYLSIKSDKRKFRLYTSSRSFAENEAVSFFADVYNDSYEFTPEADVKLRVMDENGKEYTYALSPSDGMYRLRLGVLPPGRYSYSGTAGYNGKTEKAVGVFTVRELNLESLNLTADFGWMRSLASQSGGNFYAIADANQMIESLRNREDAQAVSHTSFTLKDVIDQKWIFFLIVIVLGLEWFIRRWRGGY